MTEETNPTPETPAEAVPVVAENPAVQPEQPVTDTTEAVPSPTTVETVQTPAEPAAAAEPAKKPEIKITVGPAPKRKDKKNRPGSFSPSDAEAKKIWIAKKRQEHQTALMKSGYTPTATMAIMGYMTTNHGYEKSRAKDNLIFMFEHFSRSLKYTLDFFDRDMSALLQMMLVDVCGHLHDDKHKLFAMSAEESQQFVLRTMDSVWSTDGGLKSKPMMTIKTHLGRALGMHHPEGYAQRALYFSECIVDTSMKLIDPFEGMYHTERLEIPDDVRKIFGMRPKSEADKPKVYKKVFCEKCGQEMEWVFRWKKHVCRNALCTEYVAPPANRGPRRPFNGDRPQRAPEKISKSHEGGYDSGRPIVQESASEKFKKKFSRPQIHATVGPKDDKGKAKVFEKDNNPFAALDKLKVEQPAPTPAPEAPKKDELPPPPAEVPVQ